MRHSVLKPPCTNMKNIFKKWLTKYQAKEMKRRAGSIFEDFKVIEKDNKIWLTHMGFAFKEIPNNKSAAEIAKELNNARQTAIRYEGFQLEETTE